MALSDMICEEIMWATKAAHSIESGYVRLEMAQDGGYRPAQIGDNAYFSCALFCDGRHIPLPLLIPDGSVDTLQARVIEAARAAHILDDCIDDCSRFVLASGSHDDGLFQPSVDWLEKRDPAFVFAALAHESARQTDYLCQRPLAQQTAMALKEICALRGIEEVA